MLLSLEDVCGCEVSEVAVSQYETVVVVVVCWARKGSEVGAFSVNSQADRESLRPPRARLFAFDFSR
jgi:hypothetical protein